MKQIFNKIYSGALACAAAGALLLLAGRGAAAPPDGVTPFGTGKSPADKVAFTLRVGPADTFDDVYQSGATSAAPFKARRGEVVRLSILGNVTGGAYTYPVTKRTSAQDELVLTRLVFQPAPGLVPLWPVYESDPKLEAIPKVEPQLKHKTPFVWAQDVLILPEAKPGPHKIQVTIDGQACDENSCDKFKRPLEAVILVSDEPAVTLAPELAKRRDAKEPPTEVVNVQTPGAPPKLGEKSPGLSAAAYIPKDYEASLERLKKQFKGEAVVTAEGSGGGDGLLGFILAGVFWGAVSLITPCVFPMIPITVSYFLKQSEKEHHRPIAMASVYCATIVIVLTIAAAALLGFFRVLSINPIMNIGLGLLFVVFALSLFGMYDIELPSGLARFTSEREGKGGMLGTVFMALTFTIISFACVAPFLGGFGGTAGTEQRPWWHTILGALAFSVTFAAPFFVLALFPALLRKMPKSGSWLNSVKVVMGFLELAAALKFFRAAELVLSPTPSFFTFDFVLGCYVVLAFLCGLYLLNAYRLPHDTPSDHLGVPRLMFAFLFLAIGVYLAPGMFAKNAEGERQRPSGTIFAWVDSFLLPDTPPADRWTGNLEYAVEQARKHRRETGQPKLVFIDFTGVT